MTPSVSDPVAAPADALSLVEKLYHSGAWFCLGIVAAFMALRWASQHVDWLEEDHRAVYVSAALGGLAVLIVPATQGATPNVSMILSACVTAVALALNPKKAPSQDPPTASAAKAAVVALMIAFAASCSGAGANIKTMTGAFASCANADLGQVVTDVAGRAVSLLSDVAAAIEGNATSLEADLTMLAAKVGFDTVLCAIAAADAVLTPIAPSLTAVPAPATAATPASPGLARAREWSVEHQKELALARKADK